MPLKLVGRIESILSLSYSHLPEFVWMYLQCKDPRALRALNHKHWSSGTNSTACGYFKDLLEPCIQMEKYFCCSWSRSTRASRLMLENGQKKIQVIQSKKNQKNNWTTKTTTTKTTRNKACDVSFASRKAETLQWGCSPNGAFLQLGWGPLLGSSVCKLCQNKHNFCVKQMQFFFSYSS